MKLISIILVIIIGGSGFIPCSDAENDSFGQQGIVITPDGDHSDQADVDFCPPLCSCHCCHSHITTPGFLSYVPHIELCQELSSYYSDHLLSISHSIWQPPKVA